MKSKVYNLNDEDFKEIILSNRSYSDCLRAMGLKTDGGSSTDVLKRRICELDIDISHFTRAGGTIDGRIKYTMEEILIVNSKYTAIHKLKSRLLKENLLQYNCALCNIGDMWNGVSLVLQLDHINGINNDHRLENLRFLCPNCHSQTETFGSKNIAR